jgi:hypothetical protein
MVFKNAEGIPMVEEVGWKLVEQLGAVGSNGRRNMDRAAKCVMVKLTSLLI